MTVEFNTEGGFYFAKHGDFTDETDYLNDLVNSIYEKVFNEDDNDYSQLTSNCWAVSQVISSGNIQGEKH